MTRNRASAKAAGQRWQRLVAAYLDKRLSADIEVRALSGAKDRGDVQGVRAFGERVVIEAKDYNGEYHVSEWLTEAEKERDNDGAAIGVVAAKRRGKGDAGDGVVMMTLATFAWILERSQK